MLSPKQSSAPPRQEAASAALIALGERLKAARYRFVTPTPASHARVLARGREAADMRDVFGWSMGFRSDVLFPPMLSLLEESGELSREGGLYRSRVRFSTLDDLLLVHSAFPTRDADSVFFGPDTYRFVRAIKTECARLKAKPRLIVDIGAGTGAGALAAGRIFPNAALVLGDINDKALRFSAINAALNGATNASVVRSDILRLVRGAPDLILANPPYLVDAEARTYRHGGGAWGFDLSLRILDESLERLAPGGTLLLYTGSAIVQGRDLFREAVEQRLRGQSYRYEEIDPDVFGEELEAPPYDQADRIAVVLLVVTKEVHLHAA